MSTIKTPVHALKPGDRLLPTAPGEPVFVVLTAARAEPGPVGLQLARLGEIPAHLDRVATVAWDPLNVVEVDGADLTPEQAAAGELLEQTRYFNELVGAGAMRLPSDEAERLGRLVERLVPPLPPTLEEVLAVLDRLCNDGAVGPQLNAAERLLHQARAAGVLPRV